MTGMRKRSTHPSGDQTLMDRHVTEMGMRDSVVGIGAEAAYRMANRAAVTADLVSGRIRNIGPLINIPLGRTRRRRKK